MNKNQYMEIFIEETKEHLQSLDECLFELEKDPENKEVLNEIFRVAHTLKGMAGTMGFNRMAKLTHDMENVLQSLRSDTISVNDDVIDVLFKCMDALEEYVDNIVNTSDEGTNDYLDIINALNALINTEGTSNNAESGKDKPDKTNKEKQGDSSVKIDKYQAAIIKKAGDLGVNAYQIRICLNPGCVLKSARAFIIFQTLEKYSEIIKSDPKVEDIEDEKFDFEFTVIILTKESEEVIDKALNSISEIDKVEITKISSDSPEIIKYLEEQEDTKSISESVNKVAKTDKKSEKSQGTTNTAARNRIVKTIRVEIDRLDVLLNLTGELIITKTRLKELVGSNKQQELNDAIEYLERITTSLNDAVMKVRMVPVEAVFNRFPKMVRSISKELGKDIELIMSGADTELDKTVIDEIGDPLVHLLRNSVDHGIESREKRIAAGKPEVGHIYLRAYQAGNNVIIEVEDDGGGIDVDKIKKKAVEKGFLNSEAAKNLTDREAIDLLFKPSFSTADKVTDLSGRGVGLDVVRTKIESLGGRVEVESELGKGSKFIIKLPLTLAIIQALLVMVGNEKYAVPLSSISRILNITEDDIKMVQKQEVILLGEDILPVVRLENVLNIKRDNPQKEITAVIVKKGEKQYALLVDSVIGQQEIVQKGLGKILSGTKYVTGATILGDGNVALIIDVSSIF